MTAEETIRLRLLAITNVTALVGTRIYLDKLPQSPTYPCVRVTLVLAQTSYHLRGETDLKETEVQVDAYAREVSGVDPYALVVAVADAIHGDGAGSGLSGWVDLIGSPGVQVCGVFRVDRRRSYDPEELRVVTMSQDYRVRFRA